MTQAEALTDAALRDAIAAEPQMRPRDLADRLGVAEAALLAAQVGDGATRIAAHPDRLIPAVAGLGEVMALTRNADAVHEKTGVYTPFEPGEHAAMVLGDAVDLRMFPKHWVHAFAVTRDGSDGPKRSIQVFDAAGDAVHKMIVGAGADAAWHQLIAALATPDKGAALQLDPRPAPEGARMVQDKADLLRSEWTRLTDTHQFLRLVSKLKMNRLGAYRLAGAPFAEALAPEAVSALLEALSTTATPAMVFVGNRGCIQIHSGPVERIKRVGPWQNVLDPGFNLHLREDRIAEVWLVDKPTRRGPARSVEAFNADGGLICQIFAQRGAEVDHAAVFAEIAATLPRQTEALR